MNEKLDKILEILQEHSAVLKKLDRVPDRSSYSAWTPEKLDFLTFHYLEGSSVLDIIMAMQDEFDDCRTVASIVFQIEGIEKRKEAEERALIKSKYNLPYWTKEEEEFLTDSENLLIRNRSIDSIVRALQLRYNSTKTVEDVVYYINLLNMNKDTLLEPQPSKDLTPDFYQKKPSFRKELVKDLDAPFMDDAPFTDGPPF